MSLPKINFEKIVKAERNKVFDIAANYEQFQKILPKYPELHEVFVIGGDAKGSHIIERYESIKDGTKITFEADLNLSGPLKLVAFFGRSKIKKGFTKIMDEFAKIAEQ